MIKRSDVIRKDDIVILKQAVEFIRCGYEPGYRDYCEEAAEKFGFAIYDFLDSLIPNCDNRVCTKITDALGFGLLQKNLKNDNERKLVTNALPSHWVGSEAKVVAVKYVKTGKYNSSFGKYEDYEPAYLTNEKTHKVLRLRINVSKDLFREEEPDGAYYPNVEYVKWVLAEHVEKVK